MVEVVVLGESHKTVKKNFETEMWVDGEKLSLNHFVQETVANVMVGFSKTLKGLDSTPEKIELKIKKLAKPVEVDAHTYPWGSRKAENEKLLNALKGIYVLIIHVSKDTEVNVGALGRITFTKGLYAYVGSTQTNLERRIKRHFRKEKRKFWHIDYLLDNAAAKILKVFFKKANKPEECKTAKIICEKGKPVSGFGSSDCNCKSHLFHMENYRFLQETMQVFPSET